MLNHSRPSADDSGEALHSPDETVRLLGRIRAGDDRAVDDLLARLLPRLRRWAHGRLPRASRPVLETGDIVQVVASKAARRFAELDIAVSADLAYYLREAVRNEIASQWRRAERTPAEITLAESLPSDVTSPIEMLMGVERMRRYERALARLEPRARAAIIGRFELGYTDKELAAFLGVPTPGAARVAVHRAVKHLTEQARHV